MNVREFLGTIYLGDRRCKGISICSDESLAKMYVDCVSRIRSDSGLWGYYVDEDVVGGAIVFEGLRSFCLVNDGYLPNDMINGVNVVGDSDGLYEIEVSIDAVAADASSRETILRVECRRVYLEDPRRPGVAIDH